MQMRMLRHRLLRHLMPRLHHHGTQRHPMRIIQPAIIHRYPEKARCSKSLNKGIHFFKVPPNALFALIDAKKHLRRHPVPFHPQRRHRPVLPQRYQNLPLMPPLIRLLKNPPPFQIIARLHLAD